MHDSAHGRVELNFLWDGEVAVGFLLGDLRESADEEGLHVGDAGGGAKAHGVDSKSAVRGDPDPGEDVFGVGRLELNEAEAR